VLTVVASVSEGIVIFLQLILFPNTAALFCSLFELVSHSFWEGDTGEEISTRWHCFEKINHLRDSWLVWRWHTNRLFMPIAVSYSFFYAYSTNANNLVIVYLFLQKLYIPQYHRWLTSMCLFKPILLVRVVAIVSVIKPCACSYARALRFFILRNCAYFDSFGKIGFRA